MQQDLKKSFLEITKGKGRTRHFQNAALKSKGRRYQFSILIKVIYIFTLTPRDPGVGNFFEDDS